MRNKSIMKNRYKKTVIKSRQKKKIETHQILNLDLS